MLRFRLLAAVCALLAAAPAQAPAQDQVPPADAAQPTAGPDPATPPAAVSAPVAVSALAAPDAFSAAGRETGLDARLWRGASPGVFRAVLPLLAAKPLSPAARALARRVMATGAPAPDAIGQDPALAGQRIAALIALGGVKEANEILAKTSGLDRDPVLAQAAAESALLAGDADRACAVGAGLADGRGDIYWLRLRAYCQARRGEAGAAQLSFDLAQDQARDPVYGRLMGVRIAGAGDPGKASLRNGLDYALSHDLGLDLAQAAASPAVAGALAPEASVEAAWPMTAASDAARAVASGAPLGPVLDAIIAQGLSPEPKARSRAQTAALLLAALGAPIADGDRASLGAFTAGETKAPPTRILLLDLAAADRRQGETALIALWIASDAGPAGPASGDRARIVRALAEVGLQTDARAFALEGLLALK
jgi:hypothetical protein